MQFVYVLLSIVSVHVSCNCCPGVPWSMCQRVMRSPRLLSQRDIGPATASQMECREFSKVGSNAVIVDIALPLLSNSLELADFLYRG
jgi:hypothetical protein